MSETTAVALISGFGIAMMALISYFVIRVIILTTEYSNRKNNKEKK